MASVRRTLLFLGAVLSAAAANAQLTCGGTTTCNTTTPAYTITQSGAGRGLQINGGGGAALYLNGGSLGIDLQSTFGQGINVSLGFGVPLTAVTAGANSPAIEATSDYYHGIEVHCCINTIQLRHAVNAFQDKASGTGGYGVYGQSTRNTGVYGKALLSGQYGVYASGNLGASGTKTFVEPHPLDPTKQIQYAALEGPEAGTYFRGTAKLVKGFARISVPEDFRIVSDDRGLTVHVTPIGQLAVVACIKKDLNEIVIQGTHDVEFDFIVHGVRKAFVDFQPIVENRDFVPEAATDTRLASGLPAESVRRLHSNGTLNEDGSVNLDTVAKNGWDKRGTWSSPEGEEAKQ